MGSCRLALAVEGFRLWVADGCGVVVGMGSGGCWLWMYGFGFWWVIRWWSSLCVVVDCSGGFNCGGGCALWF